MRLEAHYKHLAKQLVDQGWAPASFTHDDMEARLCFVFGGLVNLEDSLERDDLREIQSDLAEVAMFVLSGLRRLRQDDWCLRSIRHEQNKYRSPCELTKTLRHRAKDVYDYWRKDMKRDTEIALELLLKSCIELASTLEFDLTLVITAKLRALPSAAWPA